MADRPRPPTPEEIRAAIREEVRTYVQSEPPPSMMLTARDRIVARAPTDSAIHDMREFEREMREHIERLTADKIELERRRANDERELRKSAESRLEKRDDRIWQVAIIVIGLVLTAAAVALGLHQH